MPTHFRSIYFRKYVSSLRNFSDVPGREIVRTIIRPRRRHSRFWRARSYQSRALPANLKHTQNGIPRGFFFGTQKNSNFSSSNRSYTRYTGTSSSRVHRRSRSHADESRPNVDNYYLRAYDISIIIIVIIRRIDLLTNYSVLYVILSCRIAL